MMGISGEYPLFFYIYSLYYFSVVKSGARARRHFSNLKRGRKFYWTPLMILYSQDKERRTNMVYEVYPCDLDPMGECPKRCKDCANCVGWNFPPDADEDE